MMMRAIITIALTVFAVALVAGCDATAENGKPKQMNAHLTIYVAPPLLDKGGTVIVVSNSVPPDEWRNLPAGNNPAQDDPNNEKKKGMRDGDRLFGAVASTKVAIVEFVYPEGGTFGFNLVALEKPTDQGKKSPPLKTKQILVGDSTFTDSTTGKEVKWETASTIHVLGPEASEDSSRGATFSSSNIMNIHPQKVVYEGVSLYAPTDEQLAKALIKVPQ